MLLFILYLFVGAVVEKQEIHWYQEYKSWWNAQDICRERHIDLVTVKNPTENQWLTNYGWIGLRWHDSAWRWSTGDVEAEYTHWETGEPQNQVCALVWPLYWVSLDCGVERPYYCFDKPLVLVKENKTWEEALEHCSALNELDPKHCYDLAVLLTTDDYWAAQEMLLKAAVDMVWIGLRYLGDQWSWVSGQTYDGEWSNCPESNRCGMLEKSSTIKITNNECQRKQYFLCSKISY